MPAKAGIQKISDFATYRFLDPGFRRADEYISRNSWGTLLFEAERIVRIHPGLEG